MLGFCQNRILLSHVLKSSLFVLLPELWELHRRYTQVLRHLRPGTSVTSGEGLESAEVTGKEKDLDTFTRGWHEAEVGNGVSAGHTPCLRAPNELSATKMCSLPTCAQ